MVEVFKTNILKQKEAKHMLTIFSKEFPSFKINFDLDDCDKILRVREKIFAMKKLSHHKRTGFQCLAFE